MFVPAGGGADLLARVMGHKLGEVLGQTVVVDNRAGMGGVIATSLVAKAAPDGYTLLQGGITTHGIGPHVYANLPYDPEKDFVPIVLSATLPIFLVVNAQVPVKSVSELIALAKAKPDQLRYASTGVGSNGHFGMELFKHMTGTQIVHVPYKGGPPALIDTVAGQTQLTLGSLIQTTTFIRSGKLRALAVSSAARSSILPNVPTIGEAGVPGYQTANWWGMAAPRGTPAAIVNRLNQEIKVVLQSPDTEKRFVNEGAEPQVKTPAELGKYVSEEMAKWVELARIAGIRGE